MARTLRDMGVTATPAQLDKAQLGVLNSICETLIPSVKYTSGASGNGPVDTTSSKLEGRHQLEGANWDRVQQEFYAMSGSKGGTPEVTAGLMGCLSPTAVGRLSLVLTLLSWSFGTLLLAGRWAFDWRFPYLHPFPALSPLAREKALQGWAASAQTDLRALFRAFKVLSMIAFYGKIDETGRNPTWSAIGYPGPDPLREQKVSVQGKTRPLDDAVLDLHEITVTVPFSGDDVIQALKQRGFDASQSSTSSEITVKCDVVIVGSGSGGGVIAGQLAQAGHKVLVLEKGAYFARDGLSQVELLSLQNMYEKGGLFSTADGGVALLAGSTVGGGSAINWAASFKTAPHVTREWGEELGLAKYSGPEYAAACEVVCARGGVQDRHVAKHNLPNEALRRGCEALGWDCGVVPRNAGAPHECGWCGFGCVAGEKKATSETWLVDAARAGALILTGVTAERVLLERNTDPRSARRQRARGVAAAAGNLRLVVEARVTVAAAGSLHTPALLLRSGLDNPHIGRHLHVHPVSAAWGYFKEGEGPPGNMYEGGIMTAFSRETANWNTTGYGALLMTASVHPALFAAQCSWTSGADMKQLMSRFARTAVLIGITRDRSEGRVRISSTGEPEVDYWPGEEDRAVLSRSVEANLRVLAAAGAYEIGSFHASGPRFRPAGAADPRLDTWLADVRKLGVHKHGCPVGSAHQMGSCRMGADSHSSVVDPDCESWDVAGLFLGDASVFPTASGTNPMITCQAIAYCTSQAIKKHLDGTNIVQQ